MDYFEFNGQKYYPGTKVRIRDDMLGGTYITTFQKRTPNSEGREALYFRAGRTFVADVDYAQKLIVEIIELPKNEESQNKHLYYPNKKPPMGWQIEVGWTWYLIIMVVGTLFKDRWIIYIFVTLYFFLWKNGILNGGKE